jgi:segregation and condensation protein A
VGAVCVRELELELDAFEGPFDLLLTLVLKEELPLLDVQVADVVVAFVEQLAATGDPGGGVALPLDAAGEFLVLAAALLELKARELFPDGDELDLEDIDPDEAAAELALRLAEYRRIKVGASWLEERLARESYRFFRLGPPPLAPKPERPLAPQQPAALAAALRALAAEPAAPSLTHLALRLPPLERFLERFRSLLASRRWFSFDDETEGLSRLEQAVAFLALLELRKAGEVRLDQAEPFAPIGVAAAANTGSTVFGHRRTRTGS